MTIHVMLPDNISDLRGVAGSLAAELEEQFRQDHGQRVFTLSPVAVGNVSFSTTHRDTFLMLGNFSEGLRESLAEWLEKVVYKDQQNPEQFISLRDPNGHHASNNIFQVIRTVHSGDGWVTYHLYPVKSK